MSRSILSFLFGTVILASLVGCGSNVSSGGDGGGGSGGSGGATGGTAGTAGTTTTSAIDPQSVCESACNIGLAAACFGGPVSSCVTGCVQTFQDHPDCAAEINAVYECAIVKVPDGGCDIETLCSPEDAAAKECMSGSECGLVSCAGDDTTCSCDTTCQGTTLRADCAQGAGSIDCTCFINDSEVGACTDTDLTCDLEVGCCAQFF